jgi:hypothetical protein
MVLPISNAEGPQATSSTFNTEINSAMDGSGGIVSQGGSTTSNSITFTFQAVPSQALRFECSLDGSLFISCLNPRTYSSLDIGSHLFQVRAVNSEGIPDSSPAQWTWTVLSGDQSVVLEPRTTPRTLNTVPQVENNANQAFANTATKVGNVQNAEVSAANAVTADAQSNALNPVLKRCDPNDSDYAIYDISGQADLSDLLTDEGPGISASGSNVTGTDIPISLIIFNDQKPTDQSNQIINNVQPYLKGMLVGFPGTINNQRTTSFEITKVTTECITASFQSEQKVIQESGEAETDPGLTVLNPRRLNPIFGFCNTAAGNIQVNNQAVAPVTTGPSSEPGVVTTPGAIGTASVFNRDLVSNAVVASTANTAAAPIPQANLGGGNSVDVAKYTIEGTIKTISVPSDSGRMDITFRLYSVFDSNRQLPQNIIRTGETNNQWIAAKLEIEPGDEDEWQSVVLLVNGIETKCNTIPFVDGPKTIGTQAQEFYTVPITID